MEISILQSLIARTANEIRGYELAIEWEKANKHFCTSDFEMEQSDFTKKWCKARLPKLVQIQKALKKEMRKAVVLERGVRVIQKAYAKNIKGD